MTGAKTKIKTGPRKNSGLNPRPNQGQDQTKTNIIFETNIKMNN